MLSKKIEFPVSKEFFDRLEIDETKVTYKENLERGQKKIFIKVPTSEDVQKVNYDELITQIFEFMLGERKKLEFNKKNQLDLIFLCDVFKLSELRAIVMSYLS